VLAGAFAALVQWHDVPFRATAEPSDY